MSLTNAAENTLSTPNEPKKIKVMIVGPMSKVINYNKDLFDEVEEKLAGSGFHVISPFKINKDHSQWANCVRKSIGVMCLEADNIVVLRGWEGSKGAKKEVNLAKLLGIPITYWADIQHIYKQRPEE